MFEGNKITSYVICVGYEYMLRSCGKGGVEPSYVHSTPELRVTGCSFLNHITVPVILTCFFCPLRTTYIATVECRAYICTYCIVLSPLHYPSCTLSWVKGGHGIKKKATPFFFFSYGIYTKSNKSTLFTFHSSMLWYCGAALGFLP